MELSSQISSSQLKETFAQESQQHLDLLHSLIAKLENSLHDIDQLVQPSHTTEEIIRINRLLQESATKADFYKPNSLFVKLSCRLEQVICQLGDRQFVPIIDPIIQELLQKILTIMSQLIDDYCQESSDHQLNNRIKAEREGQVAQLLSNLDTASVNKLDKHYQNEFLDLANLSIAEGLDNDPFSIDTDSEALCLFDLDLDQSQSLDLDLNQTLSLELHSSLGSSSSLEPETNLDQEIITPDFTFNSLNAQIEELVVVKALEDSQKSMESVYPTNNSLPMPELLVNIFHETAKENLLGNDDETELQGTVWNYQQEDLTTVAEIIDDWQNPHLPETGAIADHSFSRQSISTEIIDEMQEVEPITVQNFFNQSVDQLVEESISDLSDEMLGLVDSSEEDDFFWHGSKTTNSGLESDFFSLPPDSPSDYLPDWEMSNLADIEQIREVQRIAEAEQVNQFAQRDFNSSDIDTAIEESPIYQNYQTSAIAMIGDRHEHDLEIVEARSAGQTGQMIEIPRYQYEDPYIQATDPLSYQPEPSGMVLDNYSHGAELGQDPTIRVQLTQLEALGDLSEEIAIRNSNLDVYLAEMRRLYDTAQRNLHVMATNDEPSSAASQQSAIASLHNNFDQLVGLINHTEQQTKVMVQDIYHLRRSFQLVLKHPISSFVGKFPRILRELSLQHGKQVELIVQGADISIERSLSDVVAQSLDLLLINAFEHGIETIEERQLQGKSPQGKIEVIATQVDAQTTITVRDDGHGLHISDLPRIVKSKLQTTQTKLQEIGGCLTMQSWSNQGSEFTLILNNSCSVTEVIVITINQISMAINSNLIAEVIPIDKKHPNPMSSQLMWNNHPIPLVNLDTFFQLNCRNTSVEANTAYSSAHQWSAYQEQLPAFLIVDYQNHLFALQTDGCTYKQDGIFQQVAGDILLPQMFSGTVILGDGRAIPLLSPSELISRCVRSHADYIERESAHNDPLHNINSLSDFFDPSDDRTEPENLESSGLFVNGTEVSQPSHVKKISPRVLIVESSANVRRYLAMTLNKFGFVTEQVQNVKEAIAFINPNPKNSPQIKPNIDVVVSDLDLENIDGFQFIAQIRANYSSKVLPIVILTSRNSDRNQQLALEYGANAYFSKPYREQELITTLQKLASP